MKFWTADWHLGDAFLVSSGIRIFKNAERAAEVCIKNANTRAKSVDDTIVHLGDFVSYGNDHGVAGIRKSGNAWRKDVIANMILVRGNHDDNNNVKADLDFICTKIGQYKVTASHYPSWYAQNRDYRPIMRQIDYHIHICGHVHTDWVWKYDDDLRILNINVGIDAWKYQIVSEQEIIRLFEKVINK